MTESRILALALSLSLSHTHCSHPPLLSLCHYTLPLPSLDSLLRPDLHDGEAERRVPNVFTGAAMRRRADRENLAITLDLEPFADLFNERHIQKVEDARQAASQQCSSWLLPTGSSSHLNVFDGSSFF